MAKTAHTTSTPAPSSSATRDDFDQVQQGQLAETVSILSLGRYLGELSQLEHKLDLLGEDIGLEPPGAELTPERLKQRQVRHAELAVSAHIEAIERAIMTGRAISLADATVQVMLAAAIVDRIKNMDAEDDTSLHDLVASALESALRVLAAETNVGLASVGGAFYASAWCEHWPEVDVSSVPPDSANQVLDHSEVVA